MRASSATQLLESDLALGYFGVDALLLVGHLPILLGDALLLLLQGHRHLIEARLFALQLAPDLRLAQIGFVDFLVQRLVLALGADGVHLAFVAFTLPVPLRWHARATR